MRCLRYPPRVHFPWEHLMRRLRVSVILFFAISLLVSPAAGAALTNPAAAPPTTPQLVAVRAASHPGYDRVVWEFRGGLPAQRTVGYVDQLTASGSGLPIRIAGGAVLKVSFSSANAHDPVTGAPTGAPSRLVTGLPNVVEVVRSGDFEAHVDYGVGLARRQNLSTFTLSNPSRFVLDVRKDYKQATRRVYFQDEPRFVAGTQPDTRRVSRVVPAFSPAAGVLNHLFAGPTSSERAAGLRTVRSGATDFDRLTISSSGIARVRLLGGCDSGGSTFTIANLLAPTLKQFDTVRYVKIYDPSGHTSSPSGLSDSIPGCLEP